MDPVAEGDVETGVEATILTGEVEDGKDVAEGELGPVPDVPKGTPEFKMKYA